MPNIKLDLFGDASVPKGYLLIETEVGFLEKATSGQSLFIKGKKICKWAESFYSGRQIRYEEIVSPVRSLMDTYPGLTTEEANTICQAVGESINGLADFSANSLLKTCDPRQIWDLAPSIEHAAGWLLWLDDTELNEAFQPILEVIGDSWKYSSPELSEIYDAHEPETAKVLLAKWLGETLTPFLNKFGEFPLPIPHKWNARLEKSWRMQIIQTKGEFLDLFLKAPTSWSSKQIVALITLDYFERNRNEITKWKQNQVARFVTGKDRSRLLAIQASPEPNSMPDSPDLIIKWFKNEYLPFREWQLDTNSENAYPRVLELGRQFAKWYLEFYPQALISKENLSFFRSKALKDEDTEFVDLLIILDGLQSVDAHIVMSALLRSSGSRLLTMTGNDYCFAPLPTVTDFTKGALVRGVQPTLMKEFALLGEDVSERQTPLPLLQSAKPGDLFIWRIQDPDATYHTKNRSPMLKTEVEGVLLTIARKINDLVENVDSKIPLKIIITTDHGRFLGKSERTVDIPSGMEAEGRAAWGKSNIAFDRTGYKIDGELVFLSKDRFGLMDDDAAVILTDHAFKHEIYKDEIATHGGLFPEEVVIPWMVFERGKVIPDVEIQLSGDGRADSPAIITVVATNTSTMDLVISKTELYFSPEKNYEFDLVYSVPGMKDSHFEIEIPSWPSSDQVSLGKAQFTIDLPDGEKMTCTPTLKNITVSELYTRDKSLLKGLDL